ncbi:ATPase family AAA domain-containing protein 2-like [Plectropomus leopardus]|uniref:ATPase family AAA domain-containing protein 2-like n=1 Tax=Plectropomus leopardus TaxID=160734 RepID=UPI001C4BF475|nr:ATPase family AAA domain-containing protein 2-like [Plectropomus leopardus]
MVTARGRGRGDAEQSRGPRRRGTPARSSRFPQKNPPGTRRRRTVTRPEDSGLSDGSNEDDQSHVSSETAEDEHQPIRRARTIIRKSQRLQTTAGSRWSSGVRRSTRPIKQTRKYQASNMFDGISTNTARSVLKKMDNMKNKRRLSHNKEGKIYSKAQRRRTPVPPQRELSDSEGENGGLGDEDSRQEAAADEDSNCSATQSCDAKMSRASSLYQGPSSEFTRGSFRISASGPNTTRRPAFRPTKSVMSDQSDEDDSDDEANGSEKASGSCRPLGLLTERLLGTRRDKLSAGAGLADIDPMAIDQSVSLDVLCVQTIRPSV